MVVLCSRCRGTEVEAEDEPITCVLLEGGPCSPCKERAAILHEIKQLKAKYDAIGTASNAIHDPFIHKLPPEIGSRIFRLSLPTSNNGGHELKIHEPDSAVWAAPLKLGSVCRKWRQLAWATPDLWTNLCVGIKPSMKRSTVELLPGLLHAWLGRSGMLPLTIYFFHHGWDSSSDELPSNIKTHRTAFEVMTGLIVDLLRLHSGRWQNLHLTAKPDLFKGFLGSTEPKQLVNLELSVTIVRQLLPIPIPEQNFMMEFELNLTQIKLINFPLTSINTRWGNITHATLSDLTIDDGLDFLRRASSLEYYCVSMRKASDGMVGSTDCIFHPRLRSLHLSTHRSEEVLERMDLPSLEEWTQDTYGRYRSMTAMLSFVQRTGCCLKVLNLVRLRVFSEAISTLLPGIPSLERIRLSYFSFYSEEGVMDKILTRIFYSVPGDNVLVEDRTHESFLPHLQLIEVSMDHTGTPFSWASLLKSYREGHRRPITLRVLVRKSDLSDDFAVQLLQLTDEGVDLQIIDKATGGNLLENFRNRMHEQVV